ncbi:hypothetical protein ABPG74_013420 [Tetrahymena malaccensis]
MDKESGVSINEFVIQEAKEKSYEIEVKSLKEFEAEMNSIVDKEVDLIKSAMEKRFRQVEMEHRIKRSTAINNSRLQKMEVRNKAMMKVFSDAQYKVFQKIQNDQAFYKNLLKNLMIQGFIKLYGEENVVIRCLKKDEAICKDILSTAVSEYINLIKKEMNHNIKLNVVVDASRFLEERSLKDNGNISLNDFDIALGAKEVISKNEDDKKCFGGILLTNQAGDIIVKNTLDVRCDLAFQDSLPDIRSYMFPNPVNKQPSAPTKSHH